MFTVLFEDISFVWRWGWSLSCHTCCDYRRRFFIQRTGPLVAHYYKQEVLMTCSNTSSHGIVLAFNNIDIRVIFSWSNVKYIQVKSITQIYILCILPDQVNYLTEHLKCMFYFNIFIKLASSALIFTFNHFLEVNSREWYRMMKTEYNHLIKLFNFLSKQTTYFRIVQMKRVHDSFL